MKHTRLLLAALILLSLAGCAAERAHRNGMDQFAEGRLEEALKSLALAVDKEPNSAQYRQAYQSYKTRAVDNLWRRAQEERDNGQLEAAAQTLTRLQGIDPGNARAADEQEKVARLRIRLKEIEPAREALKRGDLAPAQKLLSLMDSEGLVSRDITRLRQDVADALSQRPLPELALVPGYGKTVSLDFRNASVSAVLEALARATGVNYLLDKDVRGDQRTTVLLKDTPVEEALDFILQTNRLEKKILNRSTVLIYPNSPEKLKEFQDLLVRSFYLGRADVKLVQANLKSLLGVKNMVIDEKLNLLIVRDTPETMRLVERVITLQDIFEPEVMLEVEVMEVNRNRLLELGVKLPSQLSLTPLNASGGTSLTLTDLLNLNNSRIGAGIGSATINLRRDVSDTNVLANPRIRVKNREKAKILIGDRVPVITTTTTATGFATESVQYLDVGLKLDVEPTIYLRNEVSIKVGLEVSSLVKEVRSNSGGLTYQVGTRGANTVLQLQDGETQILAGLINDDERSSASRVPGLGDVPLLGRLFSSQRDEHQKTEIVLAITPRIVRGLDRPDPAQGVFWSGSESYPRSAPLNLAAAADLPKPGNVADNAPAPSSNPTGTPAPDASSPAASATTAAAPASPAAAKPLLTTMTEPTRISLDWKAPAQVKAGETFEVALVLKSDGGIKSLPLQIGYASAGLQLLEVKEGGYFRQAEVPASQVLFSSNIDAASGKGFVTVGRNAQDGMRGDAPVIVLSLRALSGAAKAELQILSATAVTVTQQTLQPIPPAPLSIPIVP